MGKQKKPRRRNKNNNNNKKAPPPPNKNGEEASQDDETTTSPVVAPPPPPPPPPLQSLLQKIRHANAQTRLAALVALQQNVMLGSSSSSSNSNTMTLWQAVREQVLDRKDLAVATTAATCLTEYVLLQASSSSSSSSSSDTTHAMTAGWFLVLIGRLQECHVQQAALQSQQLESNKNTKQQQQQKEQWLALSLQCLHAVCALLETNPLVMERLERTASLRNDSLNTLWQWLDTASSTGRPSQTSTATTTAPTPMETDKAASAAAAAAASHSTFDYWKEIQEQACRASHNMAEDNWETLILPWLLEEKRNSDKQDEDSDLSATIAQRAFVEIGPRILHQSQSQPAAAATSNTTTTSGSNNNDSSSQVARLHMAGIYLSCHFGSAAASSPSAQSNNTTAAAAAIARIEQEIPTVLSVLGQSLVWDSDISSCSMLDSLCRAHAKYTQQTLDDVLEREIVRTQNTKKESARAIARRLAAVKQQQQQQAAATANNSDGVTMEDADEQEEKKAAGQLPQDRTDAVQVWQECLAQWYAYTQPLELALEIFANLTLALSSSMDQDEVMHDEDDDMMHPASNAASETAVGKLLLQSDSNGLVNRSVSVLEQLCQTNAAWVSTNSCKSEKDAATMTDATTLSTPPIVDESLGDLQSKAAAGIGHCLLAFDATSCWSDEQQQPTKTEDSVSVSSSALSLWTLLKQCLQQASTAIGRQGIASAMVVALQARPLLRQQMQAPDLTLLLSLLNSTDDDKTLSSPHLVRDAVCMLGILCSEEEHAGEVNEKVCRALLQTLSANSTSHTQESSNEDAATKNTDDSKKTSSNVEGSIIVVTEILNVLMDIYGSDDDAHAVIFDSLDVLGHFQRTLPLLKQQISIYTSISGGGVKKDDRDADLLEGWKETAMNASRFISYKKGH